MNASRAQNLHATGGQSLLNCTRVAASRMQIVPVWPPVPGKFPSVLLILHATGGHGGTICMRLVATNIYKRLAASRMQILHPLVSSCVQSRQFFASTLREHLFELKNEDAIKKSENLSDTCP